jgi:hypothetical protein
MAEHYTADKIAEYYGYLLLAETWLAANAPK